MEVHSFRFEAMNTEFQFQVPEKIMDYALAQTIHYDIVERIRYLEEKLSRFIPTSDISKLNKLEEGQYLTLNSFTFDCLLKAMEINSHTGRCFSVQAESSVIGDEPNIEILGQGSYSLHEKDSAIYCIKNGQEFDLGGIGKGYALECLYDIFNLWELKDYYISAGNSSILVSNDQSPSWKLNISRNHQYPIELKNSSISGSGDREKKHHIKYPGNPKLKDYKHDYVWVICESATYSDALATACMLMEGEQIRELLARTSNDLIIITESEQQLHFYKK